MKKRFFALFLTMALLLPAVLLSGCASADSGIMDTANLNATAAGGDSSLPVVTWKMGSVWGAGNVHFTVDQRFAELVSQLTDGRVHHYQLLRGRTVLRQPAVRLCQPGHRGVRRRLGRLLVRQGHGL